MKMRLFNEMLSVGKYMAMAMFVMGMATSCSDDDEDGDNSTFETPKYEESAAKYIIEGNNSPYHSIELTASGNYVIQQDAYSMAKPLRAASVKKSDVASVLKGRFFGLGAVRGTRSYSEVLYGKYEKTGDNTYNLEGFGTLTITKDESGNAYSLNITPNGGASKEYTAKKQNADLNSDMSNKLCRTWRISKWRLYYKYDGHTLVDETAGNLSELLDKVYTTLKRLDPEIEEDDIDFYVDEEPEQIIFTKTGTYVVYYTDGELAVSTWKWGDEGRGIMRYSWNPDSFDDENESGDVKVEFRNNQLLLTEEFTDDEDEDGEEVVGYVYTFDEVK